jgi:hypothetical protein
MGGFLRGPRRVFLLALLLGARGLADGHPQFALSTVNRYATLALTPSFGARIFYTFMVGDVPAHTLRREADENGDGTLDTVEQQALAQRLKSRLADFEVSVDGKKVPLTFSGSPLSLPDPRVSPLAFSFELTAPLPIASGGDGDTGEHLVHIDDHLNLPPVGDVELRIEEGPGVRVLATWEGSAPRPVSPAEKARPPQLQFASQGPPRSSLSDRSISVRFVDASRPPPKRRSRFGCSGGRL